MNVLVIDCGNSYLKSAVFYNEELLMHHIWPVSDLMHWRPPGDIDRAIISTVADNESEIASKLSYLHGRIHWVGAKTFWPFDSAYQRFVDLGNDRKAGIMGTILNFQSGSVLVFNTGSCLTHDIIVNSQHVGGGISPGLSMRFKALHRFTAKLPMIEPAMSETIPAINTVDAIRLGAANGMLMEMTGWIKHYRKLYPQIKIILTGGDHEIFVKQLRYKIFARPNLVLEGLHHINSLNVTSS